MQCFKEVELISTGIYLPGNPIPFDNIEEYIGALDKVPDKTKHQISKLRNIMKRILKACCYYAIDPKTKKSIETVSSLSVKAINNALTKAKMRPEELELIILGTPLPDRMTPPTSAYIQQDLGIDTCTEMEIHSNCTGMTKAMEVAFNALSLGKYKNAVVVYAQNPSSYLISSFYNQGKVAIENLLLRWFLSDSAGAMVLKASDKIKKGFKISGTYNESFGGKLKPSMWMDFGASNFDLPSVIEEGKHHFAQDYQTVNKLGPIMQVRGIKRFLEEYGLSGKDIDHLLISIPSHSLGATAKKKTFTEIGIPAEKWFDNVETKGILRRGFANNKF